MNSPTPSSVIYLHIIMVALYLSHESLLYKMIYILIRNSIRFQVPPFHGNFTARFVLSASPSNHINDQQRNATEMTHAFILSHCVSVFLLFTDSIQMMNKVVRPNGFCNRFLLMGRLRMKMTTLTRVFRIFLSMETIKTTFKWDESSLKWWK